MHEQVLLLLVAVGPHRQLGRAAEVLDGHGGEGLALPRGEAADGGDHPGRDHLLARQFGGEFGRLVGDERGEAARRRAEGMRRHVGAQQLALPRPDLAGRRAHRLQFERGQGGVHLGAEEVEHRGLPRLAQAQRLLREGEDAVDAEHERRALLAAVAAQQRVERPRLGQRLQHAAVAVARIDAAREVLDRRERAVRGARSEQPLDRARADVLDLREAEADRAARAVGARGLGDAEVGVRGVHVGRQHLDAEPRALGDGRGDALLRPRRVRAGRDQHRRHELDRVVRLQVRRAVRDHPVGEGVRLVEGVARERLDQVEQLLGEALVVAVARGAGDEALALGQHHLGDLLPHRLPHHVGLAERVAGEGAGDFQHLVLVGDDAVGLVEHAGEVGMRVVGLGASVLDLDVAGDVLHRAGAVEGDHGGEFADVAGLQLLHPAAHPAAFHLEHAEGAALGEQPRRLLVAVGNRLEVEAALDQFGGLAEDREVGEAEEVELEQADAGHVVHVELRRRQRLGLVAAVRGSALQRHEVGQRLARDHDAGGVRAGVARDPLEAARGVDQLARVGVALVGVRQLADLLQRAVERHAERVRHQPRDAVDVAVVHAERAARVADRGFRQQPAEGHDLRHALAPVALRRVADDLLAAVVGEVEVDVRHLAPLGVEEALEHQPVLRRLDVGDAEAVEHDRGGGGAAHGPRDAACGGEAGDVAHDQDVLDEARLLDHPQLVAQPLALLLAGVAVALGEAALAELAQPLGRRHPVGRAGVGQQRAPEVEGQADPLGDARRLVAGLGQFGQQRAHLLLGLEVEGAALELHAVGLVDGGVGADAQQHVVRVLLLRRGVVRVVGERERQFELARELDEPRRVARELLLPVLLQLDPVAPAEEVAVPAEGLARGVVAPLLQRRQHLARGAGGEREQALVVLGQQLAVDARLVVEAFEVGRRRQPQQVAPARLVLGEQRQVVGGALLRVAVVAAAGRDVRLEADDGVDALRARLLVELERAVERPVVGDGEGVLPQRLRPRDEVGDGAHPVEQRVLGVRMQVCVHRRSGLHRCANGRAPQPTRPAAVRQPPAAARLNASAAPQRAARRRPCAPSPDSLPDIADERFEHSPEQEQMVEQPLEVVGPRGGVVEVVRLPHLDVGRLPRRLVEPLRPKYSLPDPAPLSAERREVRRRVPGFEHQLHAVPRPRGRGSSRSRRRRSARG